MTDQKTTQFTELAANPATGDFIPIIDVSDTTMSANGTNKYIQASRVLFTNGSANSFGTVTGGVLTMTGTNGLNIGASAADFYLSFGSVRGYVGMKNSANRTILQGGIGRGIAFAVNDATFASGTVADVDTSGNWNFGAHNLTNIGSVAIGTATPGFDLHIVGSSTDAIALALDNKSTNATRYTFQSTGTAAAPGAGYLEILSTGQPATKRLSFNGTAGYLGIGVSNPSYKLDVNGQAHASSFPTSSDARLKEDIAPLTLTPALKARLNQIRAYTFHWKDNYAGVDEFRRGDGQSKDLQVGFIAQEVGSAVPQLVTQWSHVGKDGSVLPDALAVDYTRFVPILWEAVKELYARVAALENTP